MIVNQHRVAHSREAVGLVLDDSVRGLMDLRNGATHRGISPESASRIAPLSLSARSSAPLLTQSEFESNRLLKRSLAMPRTCPPSVCAATRIQSSCRGRVRRSVPASKSLRRDSPKLAESKLAHERREDGLKAIGNRHSKRALVSPSNETNHSDSSTRMTPGRELTCRPSAYQEVSCSMTHRSLTSASGPSGYRSSQRTTPSG